MFSIDVSSWVHVSDIPKCFSASSQDLPFSYLTIGFMWLALQGAGEKMTDENAIWPVKKLKINLLFNEGVLQWNEGVEIQDKERHNAYMLFWKGIFKSYNVTKWNAKWVCHKCWVC